MPGKRATVAPNKAAKGRFLYEQTLTPLEDIAGVMGISRDTLRKRAKEWRWNRAQDVYGRGAAPSSLAEPPAGGQSPEPSAPPPDRLALAERLQNAVAQELSAIESILATQSGTPGDAERTRRLVASLVRTLRELTRLDAPPAPTEPPDDSPVPQDLDELRRELSRKLERLVAEQSAAVPGEAE